jgi:hypothetical protein
VDSDEEISQENKMRESFDFGTLLMTSGLIQLAINTNWWLSMSWWIAYFGTVMRYLNSEPIFESIRASYLSAFAFMVLFFML